jgi:hypothetical protein
LTLRTKLLMSFGGMVLFAVGLALFWGFVQYKNLTTKFTSSQADLGLAWMKSEVQGAVAAHGEPPTSELVRSVLSELGNRNPQAPTVFYYLPPQPGAEVLAYGGGPMGAPVLPWYAVAEMDRDGEASIALQAHSLTGRRGRLSLQWRGGRYDLGALAVFYPTYRGRGPSVVRPLKELLVFFLVLFGVCAGIVVLTVSQFVKPIHRLEQRADGMARGDLAEPVSSGGEGDEIGRLTFALEGALCSEEPPIWLRRIANWPKPSKSSRALRINLCRLRRWLQLDSLWPELPTRSTILLTQSSTPSVLSSLRSMI